ncbi:MAG: Asp23/Gls24 family envelope stress response protein [Clostridia bacterium]|nr:Asp23/Gls24 family envelope stress response protein [Clostridia bacterium]
MSAKTKNIYGKISITNKTIAKFVSAVAMDCYGIVEFASKDLISAVIEYFKFGSKCKGVKVKTTGDRIFIDVSLVVRYGLSIKAVLESLKEAIKYRVERFTGMIVDTINIKVMGVKA